MTRTFFTSGVRNTTRLFPDGNRCSVLAGFAAPWPGHRSRETKAGNGAGVLLGLSGVSCSAAASDANQRSGNRRIRPGSGALMAQVRTSAARLLVARSRRNSSARSKIPVPDGTGDLSEFLSSSPMARSKTGPGTEFVRAAKHADKAARLIPFTYSTTQTMVRSLATNTYASIHPARRCSIRTARPG